MMSAWLQNVRSGFGRQTNNRNQQQQQQQINRNNSNSPTAYSPSSLGPPSLPPQPASPSLTSTMSVNEQAHQENQAPRKPPFFFREQWANLIVKGNFMTLAAKPVVVDEGEWLAHQVVEQNRLLAGMLKIIQEKDTHTGLPICNQHTCPTMSAGLTKYTWIDTQKNPINLAAAQYTANIQIWINGKIIDPALFPFDSFSNAPPLPNASTQAADLNNWLGKPSGFPQRFGTEIRNMYKQMFRCYAHMYWSHWLEFYHLSAVKELNTCFIHFINVGRLFELLTDKDCEPMAPLVEIWVQKGWLSRPEPKGGVQAPNTEMPGGTNSVATTSA